MLEEQERVASSLYQKTKVEVVEALKQCLSVETSSFPDELTPKLQALLVGFGEHIGRSVQSAFIECYSAKILPEYRRFQAECFADIGMQASQASGIGQVTPRKALSPGQASPTQPSAVAPSTPGASKSTSRSSSGLLHPRQVSPTKGPSSGPLQQNGPATHADEAGLGLLPRSIFEDESTEQVSSEGSGPMSSLGPASGPAYASQEEILASLLSQVGSGSSQEAAAVAQLQAMGLLTGYSGTSPSSGPPHSVGPGPNSHPMGLDGPGFPPSPFQDRAAALNFPTQQQHQAAMQRRRMSEELPRRNSGQGWPTSSSPSMSQQQQAVLSPDINRTSQRRLTSDAPEAPRAAAGIIGQRQGADEEGQLLSGPVSQQAFSLGVIGLSPRSSCSTANEAATPSAGAISRHSSGIEPAMSPRLPNGPVVSIHQQQQQSAAAMFPSGQDAMLVHGGQSAAHMLAPSAFSGFSNLMGGGSPVVSSISGPVDLSGGTSPSQRLLYGINGNGARVPPRSPPNSGYAAYETSSPNAVPGRSSMGVSSATSSPLPYSNASAVTSPGASAVSVAAAAAAAGGNMLPSALSQALQQQQQGVPLSIPPPPPPPFSPGSSGTFRQSSVPAGADLSTYIPTSPSVGNGSYPSSNASPLNPGYGNHNTGSMRRNSLHTLTSLPRPGATATDFRFTAADVPMPMLAHGQINPLAQASLVGLSLDGLNSLSLAEQQMLLSGLVNPDFLLTRRGDLPARANPLQHLQQLDAEAAVGSMGSADCSSSSSNLEVLPRAVNLEGLAFGDGTAIIDLPIGAALAAGSPLFKVPEMPPRFKVLPLVVQARIIALIQANPVISLKDFDDKVVNKMCILVETYGPEECLSMLAHLEHRMRTKQGAMKNGPGYLDVAVSSHLDMLKAQGSCPKSMRIEDYAKHALCPQVFHELREAVQCNRWLEWEHLDQGIIQLVKKLPRESAVEKLQEISYHSFKNVDNIKGCIMSILNSKIREDRKKQ
mmetsp:Transcript_18788/g.40431  ORF Transcript_18788/g.40431 Transcript_18788/m.40431 type:complete len:992 (-) Transcript_18788:4217-7192(-)